MQARPVCAALLVALSLSGMGCARTADAPQRQAIETSYPSPDYPPASASETPPRPAPVQPAAPTGTLYGPVDQAGTAAPAPVAPAPGAARPTGPRPGAPNVARLFNAMDTDHNGRVTLEEWRNFHEREFRRLDKNNDGVLTRDEMAAPPPARPGGLPPAR